ncbi:hypothetical protein SAMN05661080_03608 [Modestobacter sp. DSM 44400]|uniref:hypothetical protein n=1 Tax=Modestobacter sp. DSM 44400 TaxID=1550230 RepID=UPI00089B4995|nr:hypothetical protein [Modestobacter sp. DSM 44400]SDY48057.1 hypothetical protein SAMN05661080_03608 [Modestobacter sp. DSM 44400]
MKRHGLLTFLVVLATCAGIGLIAIFSSREGGRKDDLWFELGKGLIQLIVVVVFGTVLKLLVDRYQDQALRAAQHRAFRQDKYNRLVGATNQLRRVPILIAANRSVKTWSEQMLALIDTGLDLRMIEHEIASSDGVDAPFPDHAELVALFKTMYGYTDWVTEDFAERKKELSELQRRAEEQHLPEEQRAHRQAEVWNRIRELPSVADMLESPVPTRSADGAGSPPAERPSWAGFEQAERCALRRITTTTLVKRRSGRLQHHLARRLHLPYQQQRGAGVGQPSSGVEDHRLAAHRE